MRTSPLVAVALAALLGCSQGPQRADSDTDDDKKEWKEIAVKVPPYPRNENLVQFAVGEGSAHRFYIDSPSLAIGMDGVVRYTLVTRAAGGATNVTYEGIRCEGRGHKYYAVGEPGGTWTEVRNSQWRRIEYQDLDRQRLALIDTYFCQGRTPRRSAQSVLERLRYGPPASEVYGSPDKPFQ